MRFSDLFRYFKRQVTFLATPNAKRWHAVDAVRLPYDMTSRFPVGAKLQGGGVVIGYELKVLYKDPKPSWFVVVMFKDGRLSSYGRGWMQTGKVGEIIDFATAEELIEKATEM